MKGVYDHEGDAIIRACALGRLLHQGNGGVVRKLQASLAKLCVVYSLKRSVADHERFLDQMRDDIALREDVIRKELASEAKTRNPGTVDPV